ncbi:MAG: nucleotidyl transferase AbiEii/AbiGii toxin family protein [Pseudomonadota bacterium]
MSEFVNLTHGEREVYFRKASEILGLNISIIEKDFWVCWILDLLFNIENNGEPFTFKGGTSLSKIYRIIQRFSEDIDISIDKEFLGFKDGRDPENVDGTKKREKLIKELSARCKEYINNDLFVKIKTAIQNDITSDRSWSLDLDVEDPDEQTILFSYPTISQTSITPYVRKQVKIEFGARGDPWPTLKKTISPYVEEAIPGTIQSSLADITVLEAKRTYWEKATILHMLYYLPEKKVMPPRMSRHYYDFYMLTKSEIHNDALSNLSLLERVAKHKAIYFRSAWARYDLASPDTIKIVPSTRCLKELKDDYIKMREMFFEKPPELEDILEGLKTVEKEIRATK